MVKPETNNACKQRTPQNHLDALEAGGEMFRRRAKNSIFQRSGSFSESALSSSYDDDTDTFDESYYTDGSGTNTRSFWSNETDGETDTAGSSFWSGDNYTKDTSRDHQSPCFGNGFFRGPYQASPQTRASETHTSSDPGCMNFIWESSSDEEEEQKFKLLRAPIINRRKSNADLGGRDESRDETSDILQEAFSFVSKDRADIPKNASQARAQIPMETAHSKAGQDHEELDAKLYNLLLTTGSSLLGIDGVESAGSTASSTIRRRNRGARAASQPNQNAKTSQKQLLGRTFMAPWNRQRRGQRDAVKQQDRRDEAEAVTPKTPVRSGMKSSNPFSGRLSKRKNIQKSKQESAPAPAFRPKPVQPARQIAMQPARQIATDKRLNDAIMVFAAEERPLPSTLPRTQSSKFVPSKELKRQMERNIDRESFISDNELPQPDVLQQLPALSRKYRSKSQPRNGHELRGNATPLHPLERQASKHSRSRSGAKSSNRSAKSKGHRSQGTSKSRQTRSTNATRSRKSSQLKAVIPNNQLSFSDDDGNGFFSVGSLDA